MQCISLECVYVIIMKVRAENPKEKDITVCLAQNFSIILRLDSIVLWGSKNMDYSNFSRYSFLQWLRHRACIHLTSIIVAVKNILKWYILGFHKQDYNAYFLFYLNIQPENRSCLSSVLLQTSTLILLNFWVTVSLFVQEWARSTWTRWSASAMRSPSGTAPLKTRHQRTVSTWRMLLFAATCRTWASRTRSDLNLLIKTLHFKTVGLFTWDVCAVVVFLHLNC